MLPFFTGGRKKRKSSALDDAAISMWGDSTTVRVPSSVSSSSTATSPSSPRRASLMVAQVVARRRGCLVLSALGIIALCMLTVTNSSTLRSQAAAIPSFRSSLNANNQPNEVANNHKVMTFPDAIVLTSRTTTAPHLRGDTTANRLGSGQSTQVNGGLPLPESLGFVVVADLDKKSKDTTAKKPLYFSYLQQGTLKIAPSAAGNTNVADAKFSVEWGELKKFTTTMNEAGRGFELSELTWFQNKLLAFDDRTGIVFHLSQFESGGTKPLVAIPEHIIMEGDGQTNKGQKHEWATVKDNELVMGSIGKEFTDNDGNVVGDSNLWVAMMDTTGSVRHEDWTSHYTRIRKALGCEYPGYVIHEAIEWSAVHRKWFILPRRVSTEPYNDELDETRGSNKLVIASEDFSSVEVVDVGTRTPLRGFSSFKFLPRSQDSIILALKSVEIEAQEMQTTFITAFDIEGHVLLEETELPAHYKFEGLAFEHEWS